MTRPHRLRLALVVAPLLGACASSGNTPAEQVSDRGVLITQYDVVHSSGSERMQTASVSAPVDKVWSAATAAYGELGLELNNIDSQSHKLGTLNTPKIRELANTALSRYFDCGSDLTGPRANRDRVYITLTTTLAPDASGTSTTFSTISTAYVRTVGGSSSDTFVCQSTGALEQRLNNLIKLKTAA